MESKQILGIILVGLFIIWATIWMYWQLKQKGLRKFTIDLIVRAEDKFAQGDNKAKFEFVVDAIKSVIPMPFSLFITTTYVENFVQNLFNLVKNALDFVPSEEGDK